MDEAARLVQQPLLQHSATVRQGCVNYGSYLCSSVVAQSADDKMAHGDEVPKIFGGEIFLR